MIRSESQITLPAAVVVNDPALADQLRSTLGDRVVAVDHYLDAIGELSQRPVELVVGRIEPMADALESTLRALRQTAPTTRVVLSVEPAQEPAAMRAVRLGIDDYLIRPVAPSEVLTMLGIQTPPPAVDASDSAFSLHVPSADSGAGDSALIDQLLADRRGMKELALNLLRRRSGAVNLEWAEKPADDRVSVPVQHQNVTLGYLLCSPIDSAKIADHIPWLARWLALDRHIGRLNELALRDPLTGVWNRRYFDRFLESILQRAKLDRFRVTVMVYDIDDFKKYNDRFGHAAGDEILQEAARLMQSVVRKQDVVSRIGGDEFAVIFWDSQAPRRENSEHPQSVRRAAERFQRAICEHRFPKLGEQAPGTLTISGGLASFPWDGATPADLMQVADQMLIESKNAGKNALTFGPGAMKMCGLDQAKQPGGQK